MSEMPGRGRRDDRPVRQPSGQPRTSGRLHGQRAVGRGALAGRRSVLPQTPVAGWLSSATHREIILNPTYREAGIGCYFREGGPVREARCVLVVAG